MTTNNTLTLGSNYLATYNTMCSTAATSVAMHGIHLRFDNCDVCAAKDAAFRRLWVAFLILCCQVVALAVGFIAVVAHG